MPIQVEYDIDDKEEALKSIVKSLKQSPDPKISARELKQFVREVGGLQSEYKTLFKHEMLSNFKELIEEDMGKYDAGDVLILADKKDVEEKIENMVYERLKTSLD